MRARRIALEPRARRAAVLVAAIALLVLSAPAEAKRKDQTPPTFAGLESATTCIPGPGNGTTAKYNLHWQPATDNVSPSRRIVYDIYQATTSGGEDFSTPTYTTSAGATSFTSPPLSADKTFYFVVRARDQAGNRDSNTVEREGQNICV